MTRVEIFAVQPNGDMKLYGEARNAWGGAMHIWRTLDEVYQTGCPLLNYKQLWASIGKLSKRDQWVLASTYDWMLVSKEQLPMLIKHLTSFCEQYPSSTLDEEIAILERAVQDESVQAIGINQTSVCDMWWHALTAPESVEPASDEEEGHGERQYYNINRETKHWYLTPEWLVAKKKKA